MEDPTLGIETVNFRTKPEETRQALNAWVKNKTQGKIEDLLPGGSIDQDTALVILNAVYFNGAWKHTFNREPSYHKDGWRFKSSIGKISNIQMMSLKERLPFNSDSNLGVQAVELPYSGDKYSMVLMLPNRRKTVDSVVQDLDATKLKNFLSSFYQFKINLLMPKFKIEKSYQLKNVLKGLGARKMFQDIKIPGIVESFNPLAVSDVVHKSFIEVSEEGTEAAAASGIRIVALRRDRSIKYLVFNRPFLFVLKNIETNAILFMGVVREL